MLNVIVHVSSVEVVNVYYITCSYLCIHPPLTSVHFVFADEADPGRQFYSIPGTHFEV